MNKKNVLTGLVMVGTAALVLAMSGCKSYDVTGKWELTLKWSSASSTNGTAPPPTVHTIVLRDGKVFQGKQETGYYKLKGERIRFRPGKIKILCYGTLTDANHMSGEISYFPTSTNYGTWTAERHVD